MNEAHVTLAATGHDLLFTHAALWGAGAIAAQKHPGLRLGWQGDLTKTAVVFGIDADELAATVHGHAQQAQRDGHWVQADLPHESGRALFSPRIKPLPDPSAWTAFAEARQQHLDALSSSLDARMIAGLGEPSSWHEDGGKPRQDHGASRLEMQPRNSGSEFVGTRMRSLANAVASRSPVAVRDGLIGAARADEAGENKLDSRSAANLMPPRVTDNAIAWVAMWGLASAPVAHRVNLPSRTATHLPRGEPLDDEVRAGHVVVPFWSGRWTVARLRAVLRSGELTSVGLAVLGTESPDPAARSWLRERGVVALQLFPIHTFGSTSSPERRAMASTGFELLT